MVSKVLCMAMAVASVISASPGVLHTPAVVDRVEDEGIAVIEVCVDERTYFVDVYQSLLLNPLVDDQEINLTRYGTSYWLEGIEVLNLGPDGTYQSWPTVVDYD